MTPPLCPPSGPLRKAASERPQFSLRALFAFVTIVALVVGGVPWLKKALTLRRYVEIRYSLSKGEMTEAEVREMLGDKYAAYREFVDSMSDP